MKRKDWLLIANMVTIFFLVLITMRLFNPEQWIFNGIVNLLLAVIVVHGFNKIDAWFERRETE